MKEFARFQEEEIELKQSETHETIEETANNPISFHLSARQQRYELKSF